MATFDTAGIGQRQNRFEPTVWDGDEIACQKEFLKKQVLSPPCGILFSLLSF